MLLVWREKTPGGWRRFLVCYWCGERRYQVAGGGFWCVTGVEREDTSWLCSLRFLMSASTYRSCKWEGEAIVPLPPDICEQLREEGQKALVL